MKQKPGWNLVRLEYVIFLGWVLLNISACQTPSHDFSKASDALNFKQMTVPGQAFQHRLFLNRPAWSHPDETSVIHVYFDGDGSPWINHRWQAKDPTSRNALILKLMHMDPAPSLLIGRPCYHGFNDVPECQPKYWTSHRYASEVVVSMAEALSVWIEQNDYRQVILIGHSGGGVLAMLVAPYLKRVQKIVTIAANLDIQAWSEHHGYLPLANSLNPADRNDASHIQQLHIAGGNDRNVPWSIIQSFSNKQQNAEFMLLEQNTHVCCWEQDWPGILQLL